MVTNGGGGRPRRWWHLRWLDVLGLLGMVLLIPQIIVWTVEQRPAEPTLAGVGLTLVLAASGGSRVTDEIAKALIRRKMNGNGNGGKP